MSRVATALHSSKLLYSREMPMFRSMSRSVMRCVPSGSETSSFSSSLAIFDTSHPKWSVSIDSAFSSIRHPFEAMNPDSHGPIS